MAEEVAVGYIQLLPSMRGFGAEVRSALKRELSGTGKDLGADLADGLKASTAEFRKAGAKLGDAADVGLTDGLHDSATGLRKAGEELSDSLADGLKSSASDLKKEGAKLGAAVDDGLKSSTKGAKGLGSNLTDSLKTGIESGSGKIKTAAGKLGSAFKLGLAGVGAAAGALLATGVAGALEAQNVQADFRAAMGGSEWAAELGKEIGDLYSSGVVDSAEEARIALEDVSRAGLFEDDASAEAVGALTEQFATVAKVLRVDMTQAIDAVDKMVSTGLAPNAEAALDIITVGIQRGVNQKDDYLDVLGEYAVQFQKLGLTGEEATQLMQQGLQGGARDADKTADALKELAIRAADGSSASAEGFKLLGLNGEEMTRRFREGGPAARAALEEVITALNDANAQVKEDAGVALLGTQAEDLQGALSALDFNALQYGLGVSADSAEKLGEAFETPGRRLERFKRESMQQLTEFISAEVIPIFEEFGPTLKEAFIPLADTAREILPVFIETLAALAPVLADVLEAAKPVLVVVGELLGRFNDLDPETRKVVATMGLGVLAAHKLGAGFGGLLSVGKLLGSTLKGAGGVLGGIGKAFGKLGGSALTAAAKVGRAGLQMMASAAKAAGRVVAQIGLQIARWAVLGVQALIHAAKVAAAWLISLGPIGLIGAAVVALGVLIFKNFDKIKEWVGAAFGFVKDVALGALNFIKDNWQKILIFLTGPIGLAVAGIVKYWDEIKALPGAALDFIKGVWSKVEGVVTAPIDAAKAVIDALFGAIRGIVGGALDWITGRWSGAKDALTSPVSGAKDAIGGLFGGIQDAAGGAKDWIAGRWSGLREDLSDPVGKARGLIGTSFEGIKNAASTAKTKIGSNWKPITALLGGPIGLSAVLIHKHWDSIKAGAARLKADVVARFNEAKNGISSAVTAAKSVIVSRFNEAKGLVLGAFAAIRSGFTVTKNSIRGSVDAVISVFRGVPGRIGSALSGVGDKIVAPFREALDRVRALWDRTVGQLKVPDIPGVGKIGGFASSLGGAIFHTGGTYAAPAGANEGFALLQDGETVLQPRQFNGLVEAARRRDPAPPPVAPSIVFSADGVDRALLDWLQRAIRVNGGGNVQLALGTSRGY